jgi:hypothetical protein
MGPQDRLNEYIKEVQDRPFCWGFHDCFTFSNTGFRILYGKGYADDWVGRYMFDGRPMRRREMINEFGFSSLERALDARLLRLKKPERFCLVTTDKAQRWVTGAALGICIGTRSLFLGKNNIFRLSEIDIKDAWSVK